MMPEEEGCNCPRCPVRARYILGGEYFCVRDAAEQELMQKVKSALVNVPE